MAPKNGEQAEGMGKAERLASKERKSKEKKQVPKKGGSSKVSKKKVKKGIQSYKMYIYKVLKQEQNDLSMASKTMEIMNNFVVDICEKLAQEAAKLVRSTKRQTITSRDIEAATRLVLPGELAEQAISSGAIAVDRFNGSFKT